MARPWDRLDPKDYVRLQESLLGEFVGQFLYPFSPFYRDLFDRNEINPSSIQRLRDLERIPMVSRADFELKPSDNWRPFRALLRPDEDSLKRWAHRKVLRRMAREKLLRGDDAAERLLAEEFKPMHLHLPQEAGGPLVGYTIRDLSVLSQVGARAFTVLGARRSDVLVSTLPYGPHLPFWQTYYGAMGKGMSAFHLGGGDTVRPSRAAYWLDRVEATALVTETGYAEGLLQGAPPSILAGLRLLVLWAVGGMQGARERFTTRLRSTGATEAATVTMMGIPEARVAWAECPTPPGRPEASNGYHTYPDLELLEVVDVRTGRPMSEGEPGEIVYTSLDWRGSALLRYRTGVIARRGITRQPCPGCGRTVPRVLPDLSHRDWEARVVTDRGKVRVDLADVFPVLWRSKVALWQLEMVRDVGPAGGDLVTAYMGGANPWDLKDLEPALAAYGVRVQGLSVPEIGRRLGVGLERPEARIVVRSGR
ncbi:MAG: hypothetical protein M3245_02975 [Actinomycetota bacterium]|nr:hypothetical protein [Actinomycetota bacterium]